LTNRAGRCAGFNYPFLTSKERDIETGLDYFLARYYSSTQGRFTSPDQFPGGAIEVFAEAASDNPTFYADLTNPQTLNKYQYCVNNPLRYTDPSGHQSQEDGSWTAWMGSLIRRLLAQKDPETDAAEEKRRGPLNADRDNVVERANEAMGQQAEAYENGLANTGLDLGAFKFVRSAIENDTKGTAVAGLLFAVNVLTLGKGGQAGDAVVIGENMVGRVIPVAEEIGAKTYSPTSKIAQNWLGNNARWIASQIGKGNRIFDIGRDVNRAASKYYAKEVEVLAAKGFQRVRVGTVKIKKQTYQLYEWVK
jgi:RHS repeat-associated protein